MAAILERIVEATRARVAKARRVADFRELERQAEMHAPRGVRRALGLKSRGGGGGGAGAGGGGGVCLGGGGCWFFFLVVVFWVSGGVVFVFSLLQPKLFD